MVAEPIYLVRDKPAGPFYLVDVEYATYVTFAIDDLPELAARICGRLGIDYDRFHSDPGDIVVRLLRGTVEP